MNIVKCKIADFNVEFETDIANYYKSMRDYLCDFEKADIHIGITDDDEKYEVENHSEEATTIFPNTFKRAALFRKFSEELPCHNAFVLHSATFDIDGTGIAFAAHSGTGKSTHMVRWQNFLGDRMRVVNGDKPIVRFFVGEPGKSYAYGTPWNGKERFGSNIKTELKHICFIERSKENFVEKIDKETAVNKIMKQVYMPQSQIALLNTIQLVDRLLTCCDLWIIHCNMDENAGEIAYKSIFGE